VPDNPLPSAASKKNLGMSDPSKKHKAATIATDNLNLNESDVSYK